MANSEFIFLQETPNYALLVVLNWPGDLEMEMMLTQSKSKDTWSKYLDSIKVKVKSRKERIGFVRPLQVRT